MRRAATAVVLVALALPLAVPGRAIAQSRPSARLALASQTAWVRDGSAFTMRLDVDAVRAPQRLDLEVIVHRAVRSRSQFARTIDGALLGPREHRDRVPFGSLRFDSVGAITVQIDLPELRLGVYPVAVNLLDTDTGDAVASLVTHLVRVPADKVDVPLAVAWVQPYGAAPALQPDGAIVLDDAELDDLRTVAAHLDAAVPLTVVPTPETIGALATIDEGQTVGALAGLLADHQVLAAPFVDVDVSALVEAGRADDVARQRTEGDRVLNETLGLDGDTRSWVTAGVVTRDAVRELAELGVRQLVLDEDALVPLEADATGGLTLARPFSVEGAGATELDAFAADPGISAHFTRRDEVLGAHLLLADLAVLHLDSPGVARGVVVKPPPDWEPSEVFLSTTLSNLATSPLLEPMVLDDLFDAVDPLTDDDDTVVRELAEADPSPLGFDPDDVDRARASMAAFAFLLADASATDLGALDHLLLVAESTDLTEAARRSYIDAVTARIVAATSNVRVLGATYRLTAREGTIPLTLVNDNPFDVRVEVELVSDKLTFTDSASEGQAERRELLLRANSTTTEVVPVKARTSGTFSMTVTVRSPDGRLPIGSTRFTITSTVASGIGVLLSVGAALFLLLWWGRHWRTVRRSRRLVPAG